MPPFILPGAFSSQPNRVPRAALTFWSRLEPSPFSPDMVTSLQAEVADPAWFLARQWQYGEFQAEDAGSPVMVRLEGEQATLSRYAAAPLRGNLAAAAVDYDHTQLPPELQVEREAVRASHLRNAIDAACLLMRLLQAGAPTVADKLRTVYRLSVPTVAEPDVDREADEWSELLEAGVPDARAIATALAAALRPDGTLGSLPAALGASQAEAKAALPIMARWLAWYTEAIWKCMSAPAWYPARQEYAFAMSAQLAAGEIALVADEYTDGRIDWHTFRAAELSLGQPSSPRPSTTVRMRPMLPAPVEYAGKPADRFWEFEDEAVSFGAVDAAVTDLTRMLLVEFALVYGNDWFVVPVELPVGSLFRIASFKVLDAFGVESTIGPSRNESGTHWSMWTLSAAPRLRRSFAIVLSHSALGATLDGEPMERAGAGTTKWPTWRGDRAPHCGCDGRRRRARARGAASGRVDRAR